MVNAEGAVTEWTLVTYYEALLLTSSISSGEWLLTPLPMKPEALFGDFFTGVTLLRHATESGTFYDQPKNIWLVDRHLFPPSQEFPGFLCSLEVECW